MLQSRFAARQVRAQHLVVGGQDKSREILHHALLELLDVLVGAANAEAERGVGLGRFQLLDGSPAIGHPGNAPPRAGAARLLAGHLGLGQQPGIVLVGSRQPVAQVTGKTQHRRHAKASANHAPGAALGTARGQRLVVGQETGEQIGDESATRVRSISATGEVQATPARRALERVVFQQLL